MEFFSRFSWAVPTVFSDAIANCKFEEGDILYDTQFAYREWEKAKNSIKYYIKVKSPKRTMKVTKGDSESVALANWQSEVRIELKINSSNSAAQLIRTTQGKLFTMFWKGDVNILNEDKSDPTPPLFLKDVKDLIKDKTEKKIFESRVVERCRVPKNVNYFLMIYDPTNKVSREHNLNIKSALEEKYDCQIFQVSPEEAGIIKSEKISPVISVKVYVIKNSEYTDIYETLKKVLYNPSKDSKKDNFDLFKHGILGSTKGDV